MKERKNILREKVVLLRKKGMSLNKIHKKWMSLFLH